MSFTLKILTGLFLGIFTGLFLGEMAAPFSVAGNAFIVDWKSWHIGLTVYPNQEKKELGKPSGWKSWKTNSPNEAVDASELLTTAPVIIDVAIFTFS